MSGAIASARNVRAELPDVLVEASAEQNIRGLWSKYRPTRHRRESHEFPDRQDSEDESPVREEQMRLRRDGRLGHHHRQRFSAKLPEDGHEPMLLDLIPQSRATTGKANSAAAAADSQQHRARRAPDLRLRDVQRNVLTPLFPRRHLHQPCTLCGQVLGDDTQQLAYEHVKLQAARDRLAAEEARVEAQERHLALTQALLAREKEVEVLMAHAHVSAMKLKELVRQHQLDVPHRGDLAVMSEEAYGAQGADEHGQAAKLIQAVYRGNAVRKQHHEMRAAATCIQATHRGKARRTELAEETAAAVKMQAIQRGKLCRGELAQQRAAAVRIQASHRGNAIRQETVKQCAAAVQIQACYRGMHARDEAATKLEQTLTAAVVKIQAVQRGQIIRAEQKKARSAQNRAAASKVQSWWRGRTARRRFPALIRAKRRCKVLQEGHVGMCIEKRNTAHAGWTEGYITSLVPLMVTRDCSMGPVYVQGGPGSAGMSWDDVRLLSAERKTEVDELAALAIEQRRQQEAAAAATRVREEAKALQQAMHDAEVQMQLVQADRELAVGTRIAFHSLNGNNDISGKKMHGQYLRFKRNRAGANEHYIDFEGSGNISAQPLRLKRIVARWRVVPSASLPHDTIEDGAPLATLVAELKPGAELV